MKNLRIYLTSLGILFCYLMGIAQIDLGLSAGISSNKANTIGLTESISPNLNSHTGLRIDLDLGYRLDPNWTLYSGIGMANKGIGIKTGTSLNLGVIDIPVGVEVAMSSNNLRLPLGLKYTQQINDKFAVYAKAGTSMDYAMSGRLKTKANVFIDITLTDTAIDYSSETFDKTTFNGDLGIGTKVKYRKGVLFAELEYSHGFNNTFTDPLLGLGLKPKAISVKIGYSYSI